MPRSPAGWGRPSGGVAVGSAVGVGDGLAVGLGVGSADGDAVGVGLGVAVGAASGTTGAVAESTNVPVPPSDVVSVSSAPVIAHVVTVAKGMCEEATVRPVRAGHERARRRG